MDCRTAQRQIDAYVDGELEVGASLALEDHAQTCPACRTALEKSVALRKALRASAPMESTPEPLRRRLLARFGRRQHSPGWRWALAAGAPGLLALCLVGWLMLEPAWTSRQTAAGERVVYHISSSGTARSSLRNLANHLGAAPHARIVVVAHNEGIDFLLRGARDEAGPFEPEVRRFRELGVEFRVCNNTLERRRIEQREVIPAADLVPSGMAEISRLQSAEGFAYMRL